MSKILSYLTSLALIGAIFSTSFIENSTYAALVLTVVWVLIILGAFTATVFVIALFTLDIMKDETVKKWKHDVKKPNWWVSFPLMFLWLVALIYVEWTVTAVAYLLQAVALLLVSYVMHTALKGSSEDDEDDEDKDDEDKDDLIQYVKDPVIRESLYKAREEKTK